jgi:hypothetical protein
MTSAASPTLLACGTGTAGSALPHMDKIPSTNSYTKANLEDAVRPSLGDIRSCQKPSYLGICIETAYPYERCSLVILVGAVDVNISERALSKPSERYGLRSSVAEITQRSHYTQQWERPEMRKRFSQFDLN